MTLSDGDWKRMDERFNAVYKKIDDMALSISGVKERLATVEERSKWHRSFVLGFMGAIVAIVVAACALVFLG